MTTAPCARARSGRTRRLKAHVERLAADGISLSDVTDQLLEDGIASFAKDFDALLETIGAKLDRVRAGRERQRTVLSTMLAPVTERLEAWTPIA